MKCARHAPYTHWGAKPASRHGVMPSRCSTPCRTAARQQPPLACCCGPPLGCQMLHAPRRTPSRITAGSGDVAPLHAPCCATPPPTYCCCQCWCCTVLYMGMTLLGSMYVNTGIAGGPAKSSPPWCCSRLPSPPHEWPASTCTTAMLVLLSRQQLLCVVCGAQPCMQHRHC